MCRRMKPIIPRSKLGKRQRRALDAQSRLTWGISPVTRRTESKKTYSRKQKHRARTNDSGAALSLLYFSDQEG